MDKGEKFARDQFECEDALGYARRKFIEGAVLGFLIAASLFGAGLSLYFA